MEERGTMGNLKESSYANLMFQNGPTKITITTTTYISTKQTTTCNLHCHFQIKLSAQLLHKVHNGENILASRRAREFF